MTRPCLVRKFDLLVLILIYKIADAMNVLHFWIWKIVYCLFHQTVYSKIYEGPIKGDSGKYMYYDDKKISLNYLKAKEQCVDTGGKLAILPTEGRRETAEGLAIHAKCDG